MYMHMDISQCQIFSKRHRMGQILESWKFVLFQFPLFQVQKL